MNTGHFIARATRPLCTFAWILAFSSPAIAQAEQSLTPPMDPPAVCREIATTPTPACLSTPEPATEQTPSVPADDDTPPTKPIICACLSIEDIEPADAIVWRGQSVRASA